MGASLSYRSQKTEISLLPCLLPPKLLPPGLLLGNYLKYGQYGCLSTRIFKKKNKEFPFCFLNHFLASSLLNSFLLISSEGNITIMAVMGVLLLKKHVIHTHIDHTCNISLKGGKRRGGGRQGRCLGYGEDF